MRVDVGGPPVSGRATEEGGGVHDLTFVILEAGGVCLENELELALENLEFMLTSLVPFRVGNLGSLGGPGGGHLVCLGAGSKDIATGGYHPQYHGGSGVISLDCGELQRLFCRSGNDSLAMGLGQGVGNTRRQVYANQEAVCGFRRVGGEMGPEGLPVLLILFEGGCHVSILGSHLEGVQGQGQCRGFKGKVNANAGRFKGKVNAEGSRIRQRRMQREV